jgi:hypothetical protein
MQSRALRPPVQFEGIGGTQRDEYRLAAAPRLLRPAPDVGTTATQRFPMESMITLGLDLAGDLDGIFGLEQSQPGQFDHGRTEPGYCQPADALVARDRPLAFGREVRDARDVTGAPVVAPS